MDFDESALKSILLKGDYVSKEDVARADEYAEKHRTSFLEYLLSENLISRQIVGQAIAESLHIPFSNLRTQQPSQEQVLTVPESVAKKFRMVVLSQNEKEVTVATDNPKNPRFTYALREFFSNKTIHITYALPEDIDTVFTNYYKGLEAQFAQLIEKEHHTAPDIVDQIVEDAIMLKASDIHFEPHDNRVVVRFRIDSVLHEAGSLPKENFENVVNRIKVQARLRIDEHYSAQDGAIRFTRKGSSEPIDLRISIVPTIDGEKIAVRILSSYVRDLTLSDIGLSEDLQEQILRTAKKPFGMILVTGPTGSGKSTTLYSLIKTMNTRETNITTIEDPVEYKIEGVNQIQVNDQTNMTFGKGLRAIARQDPNIILVGEIRDLETAEIAINAALTGHLLLSTFHASNVATAIPRLIDMGVEPFLVGSTLELLISQRLVRRICDSCKVSYTLTQEDLKQYGTFVRKAVTGKNLNVYKGKGCAVCSHTGFKGRTGIYEYLTSSPELQDLIGQNAPAKDITALARKQGFRSMFEDGLEKVNLGVTSFDELVRVVAPETDI